MHKVLNTSCLRIVVCGLLAGKDLSANLRFHRPPQKSEEMSRQVLSWLLRLYGE